jgi:hypothetical protein
LQGSLREGWKAGVGKEKDAGADAAYAAKRFTPKETELQKWMREESTAGNS